MEPHRHLSDLNPYIKLCIWFLIFLIHLGPVLYLRYFHIELLRKIASTHKSPKNPIVYNGFLLSLFFLLIFLVLTFRYSSNIYSDIIAGLSVTISIFLTYSAIMLIDSFDLKKSYKAEQHKIMIDFVVEICSFNPVVVPINKKDNLVFYASPFNVDFFCEIRNVLENRIDWEKEVIVDQLFINKINHLKQFARHPYFYDSLIFELLNGFQFSQIEVKKVSANYIFISDFEDPENKFKEYLKTLNLRFKVSLDGIGRTECRQVILNLINIAESIEAYYIMNMTQFTPVQFRRVGHTYKD